MAAKAELKARLSMDTSLFSSGLKLAEAGAAKLSSGLRSIGDFAEKGFKALGIAAIGLSTALAIGVRHALSFGSTIYELSQRTGISVRSLAVLETAFKDAGLEIEDVGLSINKMQKYIATLSQTGKLSKEFGDLASLKPEDQLRAIGEELRKMVDPAARTKAAMEIFGRGGARLLPLLLDPKAMESALASIGRQADLLAKNAAAFDHVSDILNHAGIKLRGFFVGVASSIIGQLSPLVDKLDKLDFTGVGERFGEELLKGAKAVVGFISDPSKIGAGLAAGFRASVLGLGNILIAVFKTAIQFFQTGMISALAGIGSILTATLLEAFAKPIAYFQAAIIEALAPSESTTADIMKEVKRATDELAKSKQAAAEHKPGSGATVTHDTIFGPSTESLENARLYEQDLKDIESYTKRVTEAQKALKTAIQDSRTSLQKTAEELMSGGGPKVGLGEGETAVELRARGAKELSDALDAAVKALKDFSLTDVLGAGDAMKEASKIAAKAIQEGGDIIKKALAQTGEGVRSAAAEEAHARSMAAPTPAFEPPSGLFTGSLEQPVSSAFRAGTGASQPIFRRDSVLSAAEREQIIDEYVARGGERPVSAPGAYHAVKAGDEERRMAVQKAQEKAEARKALGMENTADLLKGIQTNTEKTAGSTKDLAEAWK
jgi:hypothetical protein